MFDIVVTVFVVILTFLGLWKGFVKQVVSLVGVVVAYIIAMRFSGPLADSLLIGFLPLTRHVIAFLVVFFACVIAASVLGWMIGKVMTRAGLGIFNRIAGGVLGGAKACFFVALAVMLMIAFLPGNGTFLEGSRTMKYIRPMAGMVSKYAPRSIKARYDEKVAKTGRRADRPGRQGHTRDRGAFSIRPAAGHAIGRSKT